MTYELRNDIDRRITPLAPVEWTGQTSVGYRVLAQDGPAGLVDAASGDVGRGFLVVNTGWWVFDMLRVVPAALVGRVDNDQRSVYLRCSKRDLKSAPEYDAETWSASTQPGNTTRQ